MGEPIQNKNAKLRLSNRILAITIIPVALFVSFLYFSEFYHTSIKDEIGFNEGTRFNKKAWYYKTSSTYSTYCLIAGILCLLSAFIGLIALIKKKERLTLIASGIILFLLIFEFISKLIKA